MKRDKNKIDLPSSISKRHLFFKRAVAVNAFEIKPITTRSVYFFISDQKSKILFLFCENHFCFANRTRVFGYNLVEIFSNPGCVFNYPTHAKKPILKAVDPSKYFCNKAYTNGLHTTPSGLWGSAMRVLETPSWHYLNHSQLEVAI